MNRLEKIWLSKLDISNENKIKLIKKFGGIENLFKCSLDDLVYFGVDEKISYKILDKKTKNLSLFDLEYIIKNNIEIISFEDKEYPKKFKSIKNKPLVIYIKGNKKILKEKGIRNCWFENCFKRKP